MKRVTFTRLTLTLAAAAFLSGCSFLAKLNPVPVYRMDVPQGNLITHEMIQQVQIGMSQQQVLFIMGEPLIRDDLHKNRWDYTYYYNPRFGEEQKRQVTVFFDKEGRVSELKHPDLPNERQADEMVLGTRKDFVVPKE